MDSKYLIQEHLEKIAEAPNLINLFERFAKHPPFAIKKGSFISNEGQPLERVFVIKKGFIKLYSVSQSGKDTTVYLLGPGYVLGARAFLSQDECAIHNAEAITDLEVIAISHKEYKELISEHPEYLVDLLQVFIHRLVYTENKLKGFIVGDTKSRVANFLVEIYERYTDKNLEKKVLPLPLTHQRIGEFVGAIRETITVIMNELENEDIINADKGMIEILNLEKLRGYIK